MTYEELQMINVGLLPQVQSLMKTQPPHIKFMVVLWDPESTHASMAGNMTPEEMVNFSQHMGGGFEEMSVLDLGDTTKQKQ